MPEVAKKKRVFQIAKELNISHLEIIQFLESRGTPSASHMAPVSSEIYAEILLEFSKDILQIERHRKEQARKVVVSKIQKKAIGEEEPETEKAAKITVRKLKTSLKDEKLALSEKLKDASDKQTQEKKKTESNINLYKKDTNTKLESKTDNKDDNVILIIKSKYFILALMGTFAYRELFEKNISNRHQGYFLCFISLNH